jgi:hypothetical protein
MGYCNSADPRLTNGEWFIYAWQYGMLGHFFTALAEAMARADTENLNLLRAGFPDLVEGFESYSKVDGWWDSVLAKIGETRD